MDKQPRARLTQDSEIKLTCQQITDLLEDYVTEGMAPAMRSVFEAHLHNCPDCQAFLNTYKTTIRTTRSLRDDDVPEDMHHRVRQFLQAKIKGFPPVY